MYPSTRECMRSRGANPRRAQLRPRPGGCVAGRPSTADARALPDYERLVARPLDLRTIATRAAAGFYRLAPPDRVAAVAGAAEDVMPAVAAPADAAMLAQLDVEVAGAAAGSCTRPREDDSLRRRGWASRR